MGKGWGKAVYFFKLKASTWYNMHAYTYTSPVFHTAKSYFLKLRLAKQVYLKFYFIQHILNNLMNLNLYRNEWM